ncbi:MAG: hypothetical protein ABI699_11685 [Caldimonas sp.]
MACVRRVWVGLFAALLFGIALPAMAQTGRAGTGPLRVDAFDVEQVASLQPGAQLNFSVFASPGAVAAVAIEGSSRGLELREVQPGIYEGSYTVDAGDRIRADGRVVATVSRQGAVARAVLEEPLLLDAPRVAAAAPESTPAAEPAPARPFPRAGTPVPSTRLSSSAYLPAPASVPAPAYVPAPADPPAPAFRLAPASGYPSGDVPAPQPQPAQTWPDPLRGHERTGVPVPIGGTWPVLVPRRGGEIAACAGCARVESIREVQVEASSGPAHLGAIAGGVAGALFGDRIGRAHARHVTRVLGALGGALLGREVQRQAERRTQFEVTLRWPGGAQQVRRYDRRPPLRVGESIRPELLAEAADPGRPY